MKKLIHGYKDDPNILNINFEQFNDFFGNLGNFVNETKHEQGLFMSENSSLIEGVFIFQDFENEHIAYRIYKDFADYKYTCYKDNELVSKLQEKQKDVKLSEFPMGIVTIEDKVIGQIIPYYDNSKTLIEAYEEGIIDSNGLVHYILEIIKIQKELLANGILSCDCHPKNFVIYNDNLKAIDFEDRFVYVDNMSDNRYVDMIRTLKSSIIILFQIAGIDFDPDKMLEINNLDDLEKELLNHKSFTRRLDK